MRDFSMAPKQARLRRNRLENASKSPQNSAQTAHFERADLASLAGRLEEDLKDRGGEGGAFLLASDSTQGAPTRPNRGPMARRLLEMRENGPMRADKT